MARVIRAMFRFFKQGVDISRISFRWPWIPFTTHLVDPKIVSIAKALNEIYMVGVLPEDAFLQIAIEIFETST